MPRSKNKDSEKAKKYERARMLANERSRRYKARKSEEQLEKKENKTELVRKREGSMLKI